MLLPQRKYMDHAAPAWVKGSPIFLITICASRRGTNQLCHPKVAEAIFGATAHDQSQLRWSVHLLLLMPDHLHALISFPKVDSMSQVVRAWKHYLARQQNIEWQRDYFDHRLRNDESHEEKASYLRLNPVRAGLVNSSEQWPYVWEPNR